MPDWETDGTQMVALERDRQKQKYGMEHDLGYRPGDLLWAGIVLATYETDSFSAEIEAKWPFTEPMMADDDPLENLAVAAALIIAEMDRIIAIRRMGLKK